MKEPLKPLATDCCGTGCRKCVYEVYEEQLERYKEWKQRDTELHADRNSKYFLNGI